jgi:hypothetical protein
MMGDLILQSGKNHPFFFYSAYMVPKCPARRAGTMEEVNKIPYCTILSFSFLYGILYHFIILV